MKTAPTQQQTLVNNYGEQVQVEAALYEELKADFKGGVWLAIVHANDEVHIVILPDNFNQCTH